MPSAAGAEQSRGARREQHPHDAGAGKTVDHLGFQVESRETVQALLERLGGRYGVLRAADEDRGPHHPFGEPRRGKKGAVKQHARFGAALSAVSRLVSKLQVAEVCCGGLTLEQFQTLRTIDAARDRSMGALSQTVRVDLSTMSRNVSVLEREGFVARSRHPEDSRVVTVALTRHGKEALETLCCDEADVMAKVLQRLPAAERPGVVEALELLRTALESDARAGACCADDSATKRVAR